MSDDLVYKPSVWQQRFHNLTCIEALGAGSVGPGKTACLIHEPVAQIQVEHARMVGNPDLVARPGTEFYDLVKNNPIKKGQSRGWALFLRRRYVTLEQTITRCKRTFLQLDPGCVWNEGKRYFQFTSGYRYQFGHCSEIGDWEQFLSLEFTIIMYDELVTFDEESYTQINTRLRVSDPVLSRMLKIRSMSNPAQRQETGAKVRDPNWVRKRFVDPCPEGNKLIRETHKRGDSTTFTRERIYLPAKLSDNPDKDFVRQYEEQLAHLPKHIRDALISGNWYITANSYFAEKWSPSLHVVRPFKIPAGWKRARAMDWGFKSPGHILWAAIDPEGNIIVERELRFRGQRADQVAKIIKEIESDMGLWHGRKSAIVGAADTQLWEERGDVGLTKAAEMARLGVTWFRAEKVRQTNAERILFRLDDHDHGTTTPGLQFFQSCPQVMRTLLAMRSDPDKPEVPEDGGDDHAYDALCYLVALVARGDQAIPHPDFGNHEGGGDLEDTDRGRFGYG